MIQIVVDVKDAKKGKDTIIPTVLYFDGHTYDIREEKKILVDKQPEILKMSEVLGKGKVVAKYDTISIRENVLYAIRDAIFKNESEKKVIKKYYPNISKSTISKYLWAYKNHLVNIGVLPKDNFNVVTTHRTYRKKSDRGNMLYRMNHTTIFEKVLNDLTPIFKGKQPESCAVDVFKKYDYKGTDASCMTYFGCYKRYYYSHILKVPLIPYQRLPNESKNKQCGVVPSNKTFNRGRELMKYGRNIVYENIYSLVFPELSKPEIDKKELNKIFKVTYQKLNGEKPSPSSLAVYYFIYKKYYDSLNSKQLVSDIVNAVENQTEKPKLRIRKYRRSKPKGAHGFLKDRDIWIYNDEYDAVKRAVHKFNFVATSKSIAQETGLNLGRIGHVLLYLRKRNEIYLTRNGTIPIYHPAITGKEIV
jgi:hypothetical protein